MDIEQIKQQLLDEAKALESIAKTLGVDGRSLTRFEKSRIRAAFLGLLDELCQDLQNCFAIGDQDMTKEAYRQITDIISLVE